MRNLCRIVFSLVLVAALSACADKMTDQHSEMGGGGQDTHPAGVSSVKNTGTPANTDGKGLPMAGGKQNTVPDSMWNQNSKAGGRPF